MLNRVTMKANDEPEKLFEQLGEIQNYDSKGSIDEADLMAVVSTVAPSRYQSVLSAVQLEKQDKLELEHLEQAMFDKLFQHLLKGMTVLGHRFLERGHLLRCGQPARWSVLKRAVVLHQPIDHGVAHSLHLLWLKVKRTGFHELGFQVGSETPAKRLNI